MDNPLDPDLGELPPPEDRSDPLQFTTPGPTSDPAIRAQVVQRRTERVSTGRLVDWARDRGNELFIVPVLPSASLNESIRTIRDRGHSAGALVTAQKPGGRRAFHLAWLAAEAVESGDADTGCGLPTTLSTTVADLLRILQPGASMTLRLGSDEFFLRPDASAAPIADKAAIKSLRSLSSA